MRAVRELLAGKADASFCVFGVNASAFRHPYHYHPEIELTAVLESRGQRLVGDHLDDFAPGDVVLIGSGVPHQYFRSTGRRARAVVLQFGPALAERVCMDVPEMAGVWRLLGRAGRGLHLAGPARVKIAAGLGKLQDLSGGNRFAAFIALLVAMAEASGWRELASRSWVSDEKSGPSSGWRIAKAGAWIERHFLEPLTQAGAARQVHMSPQAFSRFFRRHTGRTFQRFVNELRIGHACRLLMETDLTVSEVALESGYSNLSNFNRRFRELRGLAPRKFRRSTALAEREGNASAGRR